MLGLIAEADQARDQADWPLARRLYRTVLDKAPHRAGVWAQYGHALRETGALYEAESAFQAAIDRRPDRADDYIQLGHLLRLMARPAEAIESYVRAVELNPGSAPALDALRFLRSQGHSFDHDRVSAALTSSKGDSGGSLTAFWLYGELEEAGGKSISGWALDTRPDRGPLNVELWINRSFQCEVRADAFRRDVQDRFGGSGFAGFAFRTLGDLVGGQIEIRDAATQEVLARAVYQVSEPQLEAWRAVQRELAELARRKAELEAQLPDLERSLVFDIDDYGSYFEALYRAPSPPPTASSSLSAGAVLLDVGGHPNQMIEEAVWSVVGQTAADWSLTIHGLSDDQVNFVTDLGGRMMRRCGRGLVIAKDADHGLKRVLADLTEPWFVAFTASGVLAPDALARFASAFAGPDIDAAYGDEDCLDPDPAVDFRTARRHTPLFKPDFDPDLLHQVPYVGSCVAFRTQAVQSVGLRDVTGDLRAADALLRLAPSTERISHLEQILYSRRSAAVSQTGWAACVAEALLGETGVSIVPHEDVLGAKVDAVRVRRSPLEATASIIIPTRDKPELLKACVEGVLRLRENWATRTELIIIDHSSQDPEAKDYLTAIAGLPGVRVTGFSGPFNWALMNNQAVEMTSADVLVFLNNDTLPLSADWLDEMASQALRPEVGVVGARLVYGDRSIQHAGIISRNRPEAFLAHEGVGSPGDDPGYLGRHALMRSVVAVTGAALAVRRSVFQELGGFDAAHFPIEGNDVDFCMRAAAAGLRVLYDPYATLFHLESKSRGFSHSGSKQVIAAAAAHVLWNRWGSKFGRDPGLNRHFDTRSRLFIRLTAPPA